MTPQARSSSSFASAETLAVPRLLGRLVLLKLLARGGMGDVYLAATTGIEGAERPVVVKTVRRDHIQDGSFLARFLDEARVQAQLNHPGVAQVLEAATDEGGEPYTVIEHVEGRSLADVRQRAIQLGARVGWPEALAIGIEMAQALAHVHDRTGADGSPLGIVHRDLSPQNVMIGYAGEVKLIDFGTARGQNRRCHTVAGVVFAKPGYIAPEIARQQIGDGRIDVYALGVMVWELCAGRRFLTGDSQKHLEDAAAGKLVLPPIAAQCGAPAALDLLVERLTADDPERRYSAATAAIELGRVLAQAPSPKSGDRGVRGRIARLMHALFPHEPGRSRAEFAALLADGRKLAERREPSTPSAPAVTLDVAGHMNEDGGVLPGTAYRLVRKIGQGASGAVWEAEHMELGRKLAIKVLQPEHGAASESIEHFRAEARVLARLSHPNLVALHDFGRAIDGRVFLAMELLEGETLDAHGRRPWRECIGLALQVTCALEAAHAAGLVHRDLKPSNLFLTADGTVKLLDFGVAVALSDVSDGTRCKPRGFAIFGTPEYMAPEQISGEPVDGRADLYALGCVLYELLTGTRPFEGTSSVMVLGKQLREAPEPLAMRAPRVRIPNELAQVVMRALCKSPADRFASAAELREALVRARAKTERASKLARLVPKAIAGTVIAGALGLAFATIVRATPRPEASAPLELSAAQTATSEPTLLAPAPSESVAAARAPLAPPAVAATEVPATADKRAASPPKDAAKDPAKVAHLDEVRALAKARPSDTRRLKAWAQAARAAGELREARRAAEAWSLHDGTPDPKVFLAGVLDQLGKRAEARAVLEEVLAKYPDADAARRLHAKLGVPIESGRRQDLAQR